MSESSIFTSTDTTATVAYVNSPTNEGNVSTTDNGQPIESAPFSISGREGLRTQSNTPSLQEIENFRASVAMRILRNNTELIDNHGADFARSVIGELVLSAEKYIYIYCEKLSTIIYTPLLIHFILAHAKDVTIKIITQKEPQESDTYFFLRKNDCVKIATEPSSHEHFLLVDGIRYRQEINSHIKNAIVCPRASQDVISTNNESTLTIASKLHSFFESEWEKAKLATVSN